MRDRSIESEQEEGRPERTKRFALQHIPGRWKLIKLSDSSTAPSVTRRDVSRLRTSECLSIFLDSFFQVSTFPLKCLSQKIIYL